MSKRITIGMAARLASLSIPDAKRVLRMAADQGKITRYGYEGPLSHGTLVVDHDQWIAFIELAHPTLEDWAPIRTPFRGPPP